MTHDFMTIQEVCALTSWTKATVYTKVGHGQIPHLKLGRNLRFRREDILGLFREVPVVIPPKDSRA